MISSFSIKTLDLAAKLEEMRTIFAFKASSRASGVPNSSAAGMRTQVWVSPKYAERLFSSRRSESSAQSQLPSYFVDFRSLGDGERSVELKLKTNAPISYSNSHFAGTST